MIRRQGLANVLRDRRRDVAETVGFDDDQMRKFPCDLRIISMQAMNVFAVVMRPAAENNLRLGDEHQRQIRRRHGFFQNPKVNVLGSARQLIVREAVIIKAIHDGNLLLQAYSHNGAEDQRSPEIAQEAGKPERHRWLAAQQLIMRLGRGFFALVPAFPFCGQGPKDLSPCQETKPDVDRRIALLLQKLEDVLGIGTLATADDAGKSDEHAGRWLLVA